MKKNCKMCKNEFVGRSDKVFCGLNCKNEYNIKLRQVTRFSTKSIDNILHRNRSILLEILGKNSQQKKIKKITKLLSKFR